jgi:hypothetical protein
MPQQKFKPGDVLIWTRTEQSMRAERRVSFLRYNVGGGATVCYGTNATTGQPQQYNVNLDELSPERGPAPIPFLPGGKIPVRAPARPLSSDEIARQLSQRRDTLRAAHGAARVASDAVLAARQVCERSKLEFERARSVLVVLDQRHKDDQRALEEALAQGIEPPEVVPNGIDKPSAIARMQRAEQALHRFRAELTEAEGKLAGANGAIRAAAHACIAALIDEQCERLRQMQAETARFKARLLALSNWWPSSAGPIQLSRVSTEILTTPVDPDAIRMSVSNDAPPQWRDLLDRLIGGDADATLDDHQPRLSVVA